MVLGKATCLALKVLTQPVTVSLLTQADIRSSRRCCGNKSDNLKNNINYISSLRWWIHYYFVFVYNCVYENALFLIRILAIAAAKWTLCSQISFSMSLNGDPASSKSLAALSISFLGLAPHRRLASSMRNSHTAWRWSTYCEHYFSFYIFLLAKQSCCTTDKQL